MEEENMQSNEVQAAGHTAEAEEKEGRMPLGKFKSVDALMHAYEELQSEFTRRSQRLKQLEEGNKPSPAEPTHDRQTEGADSAAAPRDGESLYRAVKENDEVRSRIVSEYLQSVQGVPLMTGGGAGVTAPAVRAKSIAEAGKLALGYFQNHKEK